MLITLNAEHEKLIVSQIASGRFRDAEAVVNAALKSLDEKVEGSAPVYPPGSLLHLYTKQTNEEEARTASGNSLQVEAW